MKKMYAALLAAAMMTVGAGLNAQAAYEAVGGTGDAGTFQVKGEDGVTAVGIYGSDGSVHANGNVSVGGILQVGDVSISEGVLTAAEAHINGGLYAADGVHPNEEGTQVAAEILAGTIQRAEEGK